MNFDQFCEVVNDTKKMSEFRNFEEMLTALELDIKCRKEAIRSLIEFAEEIEKIKYDLVIEKRASEIVACAMQQLYARYPQTKGNNPNA